MPYKTIVFFLLLMLLYVVASSLWIGKHRVTLEKPVTPMFEVKKNNEVINRDYSCPTGFCKG